MAKTNTNNIMKMNRRRFTALLGGLSLYPSLGFAADSSPKYKCTGYSAVPSGTRGFSYETNNGSVDRKLANIYVDLMVSDPNAEYATRKIGAKLSKSTWADRIRADASRRLAFANKMENSLAKEAIKVQVDEFAKDIKASALFGGMKIGFANPAGNLNTLYPAYYEFLLPPLGLTAGKANDFLLIDILMDDQPLFNLSHFITENELTNGGAGPSPRVRINSDIFAKTTEVASNQVNALATAFDRGKAFSIQVVGADGETIIKLTTARYFDYHLAIQEMSALEADVARKAQKVKNGDTSECVSNGGCYLTTAAVDAVGLNDDCWELQTLRRYRDEYLPTTAEGQLLIAEYYKKAPQIVKSINAQSNAAIIWQKLYVTSIIPASICAKLRLNKWALKIYRKMTQKLIAICYVD